MKRTIFVLFLSVVSCFGQAPRPPVDKLSQLTDVHLTSPTNTQVLTYDSATSKWINGAGGSGAVSSVFGRTGAVVATIGDYTAAQVTNAADTTGSYANPAWIASLIWSKITSTPTTLAGYGITDAVPNTRTVNGHVLSSNVTVTASDLGATTVGNNIFSLTNPSAITFLRMNADNSVSALSASAFRTAIGAGTGGGDALTANPLSQFAATTSAQLAGVISDETGSGLLVFGTSPNITTPTGIVKGDVGLGNVTNDAQTKAAVVPNTAPSAGQILAGNAGGTAYAPVTLSGSGATATLSSAGVLTLSAIANATLSNSTITIGGTSTALGGSVLGNVTNDAQTKSAIVPNTAPAAGQLLVGNAGGTAYSPSTLSGSGATATLSSAGVLTLSAIPNATLSNSAITIAGTATSLGGSITLDTISGVSANGFLKRTSANTWTNDSSTYLTGNQTITLSGDVTGSGATAITTTNVNLPDGVTQAGSLLITDIAAPSSPSAAHLKVFGDSTDLRFHDKNAAGTIGTTVVADTGASNNFLTAISAAGVISKAQPSYSNISGTDAPAIANVTGLGTGVGTFLATPTSANLASALTDETGSGAAVFATSPTIGAATIGTITSSNSITAKKIPVFASTGNANMPVQSAMWASRWMYLGATSTAGTNLSGNGPTATFAGTGTVPTQATTNLYTQQYRIAYGNVVTTTNQQVGFRSSANSWFVGASAGQGGFLFVCRFGIEAWTSGDRLFVGLAPTSASIVTGQPSAIVNMCGFGIDASDTAIAFFHNDGSGTATKTAIAGTTLASLQGYDAYIFIKPNDSTIYYRLDDVNAGTTLVDTSTASDVPASGTLMAAMALMGNAANTSATAAQIGISSVYVEADR